MRSIVPHKPHSIAFCVGLATVMLSLWMFFIPDWLTFVHMWRVELFASVFLFGSLLFILVRTRNTSFDLPFSADERKFLVLPLCAFIFWSAASCIWAPSWRSAVHHTLIWTEYLIFYSIVRYLLDQRGQYARLLYVFTFVLLAFALPAIAGFVALSLFGGLNRLGVGFARFGEQVITIFPLVLIAVVYLRGRRLALGVAIVVTLCLFIFSTFGRANYVLLFLGTLSIGAAIFAFRRFHVYRGRFAVAAASMIVALAAANSLSMFSFAEEPTHTLGRFQDEAALSASNNFRKLMISLSGEMISAHPIIGIGADNFGFEVNRYREIYATHNPNDPNLAAAENELPERAHNEYLQIFAELGLVGFAIFLWFLLGMGLMIFRALKNVRRRSLHSYAAVVGIGLFLASSLVTSFSFRMIQNGFVFFFVLAVAAKLLLKDKEAISEEKAITQRPFPIAVAAGAVCCLLLIVYSSVRVASVITYHRANVTGDTREAIELYETAVRLDPENAYAYKGLGLRHLREGSYPEAAVNFSRAVDLGLATSSSYSYLASACSLAGNNSAAEDAMRSAAVNYPRSPFVLARFAAVLKANGNEAESLDALARSATIDPRSSKTWYSVITEGPKVAADRNAVEGDMIPVTDLQPNSAVYAVITERFIKFPEEQRYSMIRFGPSK